MKNLFTKKRLICTLLLVFSFGSLQAQLLKKLGDKAVKATERTIERRVERETSQKTDEAIEGILTGKKNKKANTKESSADKKNKVSSDFEAGNKILLTENFHQDRTGDLPAGWNTDGSGKVVSLAGSSAKWLEFSSPGTFLLENVKNLPENFTLEFDLCVAPSFSYYDYPLWLGIAQLKTKKDYYIWGKYKEKRGKDKRNGALFILHPQEEGGKKKGYSEYEIWENGEKTTANKIKSLNSFNVTNNNIKVQLWKQGQRLRVYLDGEKTWDLPQAFDINAKPNTLLFSRYEAKEGNYFYISNLVLASSGEDARSKILKEGRFSTNAILFNSGSSTIKPESDAIISEMASILQETPELKLKIIGHTDSDGKKESNLNLSKQRAAAVKIALTSKYKIAANRLETDGKGDQDPVAENTSADGKAENRRVEFLRIDR